MTEKKTVRKRDSDSETMTVRDRERNCDREPVRETETENTKRQRGKSLPHRHPALYRPTERCSARMHAVSLCYPCSIHSVRGRQERELHARRLDGFSHRVTVEPSYSMAERYTSHVG